MNDFYWDSAHPRGQCRDNHTMRDLERGECSESGAHSGDWCDADLVSMRDCKVSHKGG